MKNAVFYLMLSCFCFHLYAQKSQDRPKTYKVWVELKNKQISQGYLIQLADSVIGIVDRKCIDSISYKVSEIEQLKFRRKGRVGKSIGIGAGAGLILGAIGGYSSGDDEPGFIAFSAEDKAVFSGTMALPIGAGVGAIIGVVKKKFLIEGDVGNYKKYRTELNKYILLHDKI